MGKHINYNKYTARNKKYKKVPLAYYTKINVFMYLKKNQINVIITIEKYYKNILLEKTYDISKKYQIFC